MCGRYASTRSSADLATLFDAVDDTDGTIGPGFNLAPTDTVPVVRRSRSQGGRVITGARWGLVPPWSKDPSAGVRMINARSETVATSGAFRSAFARKRCLIPADGWYEWQKIPGGRKQPYFMTGKTDAPLVFAGLWERWGEGDNLLLTCTVLTTAAIGELDQIHDRMPLLLSPQRFSDWLAETDTARELLEAPGTDVLSELEIRPVSSAVGNVRNDGPQLTERIDLPGKQSGPSGDDAQATLF